MAQITLNICKARISSTKCCVPFCNVTRPAKLHRISREIRQEIMKSKRFFIPENARACDVHSDKAVWPEIQMPVNEACQFTAVQIEEMVDLLRLPTKCSGSSTLAHKTNFEFRTDTGLTEQQFNDLFSRVPSLLAKFEHDKNNRTAYESLYMYLLKLRTGRTNDDIGSMFGLTRQSVTNRFNKVREAMENDFVFQNVNYMNTREELAQNSTTFSQTLFANGDESVPILVFDGTYIWCQKSANFDFQKQTYNGQKKRNFVRVMVCTTTNGTIVSVRGPYPASINDASVLNLISENTSALDNLLPGDVILLDRGFRDCIPALEQKGMVVRSPDFLNAQQRKQFTTEEANRTRLVTANRYCVETRNGHLKTIFKIFQKDWNNLTLPHLMTDVRICAALINVFFKTVVSNKENSVEIAQLMINRLNTPNYLAEIVSTNAFQKNIKNFVQFRDFDTLPLLNHKHLIRIALGTYQNRLAPSYCQTHLKSNESGEFIVFSCPDESTEVFMGDFITGESQLKLLMARMKSRFRSKITHDVYVLIDKMDSGENSVVAYCCECQNGLRTVGACSHVMCLIYFTLHVKDVNALPKPAGFLDGFFNEEFQEYSDEEPVSD